MTSPFTYPNAPHSRRHGPRGDADYASYGPWLRDEFTFRCIYCLLREQWGLVRGAFALDHFQSVALYPDRVADYENLVYACATCNQAKRDQIVPDPLAVFTASRVTVAANGVMHAEKHEGAHLIKLLGLNSKRYVEFRTLWIGIISLAAQYDPELERRLMQFPDDLPDLRRLRPPGGNARPEGLARSYLVLRESGELQPTY